MSTVLGVGTLLATRPLALQAVDVWAIGLDQPTTVRERLVGFLAEGERARADRFMFERDHWSYVVCRGAVRQILSGYLAVSPQAISFAYGERGKPSLAAPDAGGLQFNVSHAGRVAVLAVSTAGPLGVDVESVSRSVDLAGLATRFFSRDEAQQLLALPEACRGQAFFNCWTRKEAYIKAIGDGLTCPLDSFAVTLRQDDAVAFRWIKGDDATRWALSAFEPAPGYVGAIAMPWAPAGVTLREWSFDQSVSGPRADSPVWGGAR